MARYYVVAIPRGGAVSAIRTNSLNRARRFGMQMGGGRYEVYQDSPKFHSTTQREYLIEHRGSPYWKNRGVKGTDD